ncbi:hypothetical protein RYA07_25880 [Pseudomonas syringae pv. actinidiae]|uniref:Uncharacterized protein n=2 Tax=Pseudomonas syringae group TaxID=136849 RepID=A0A2P0QFZ1_PSESF|nr:MULTISPECIES: hypothetical protein [Pseudomonas syringae group]ARO45312.1 hypothetical protein [Pseudomonas syringae pv. actinidiae]MDU8491772.1 hypothetical protein [Pseudomonas syringae pv. actinidiae]RMM65324.1 hypothetical protein ALQ73_200256 [Pseudomonas savastanoi pv. glycinea]TES72023.1 hypothetical protein E2N89_29850 [Pseudomonas syringae pv. tomato]
MTSKIFKPVCNLAQGVTDFVHEYPLIVVIALAGAFFSWRQLDNHSTEPVAASESSGPCVVTGLKDKIPQPDADGRVLIPAGTQVVLRGNCFKLNAK